MIKSQGSHAWQNKGPNLSLETSTLDQSTSTYWPWPRPSPGSPTRQFIDRATGRTHSNPPDKNFRCTSPHGKDAWSSCRTSNKTEHDIPSSITLVGNALAQSDISSLLRSVGTASIFTILDSMECQPIYGHVLSWLTRFAVYMCTTVSHPIAVDV